jgi:hypothetical protein
MDATRTARVGFVILKLRVEGATYYLMRFNPKWKDINFIGGHEKSRDTNDLKKTAQREFWEEVPSIRSYADVTLEALTDTIDYGPVYSKSRGDRASYVMQFFLVRMPESPNRLIEQLSSRSKNIWVPETEFLTTKNFHLSDLARFFAAVVPGGLESIPLSSTDDLSSLRPYFERRDNQPQFAFR